VPQPGLPSLTKDIYPILRRVVRLASVTDTAAGHHGIFDLVNPQNIAQGTRQSILSRLRDPNNVQGAAPATMPLLWDDSNGKLYVVTKLQYRAMQKWAGQPGVDWVNDWAGPPALPTDITPDGLTRAALEACVGGALFPGIEASWMLRDKFNFTEAFRIDQMGRAAGDVTKQMAVPWQADFYECRKFQGYAWCLRSGPMTYCRSRALCVGLTGHAGQLQADDGRQLVQARFRRRTERSTRRNRTPRGVAPDARDRQVELRRRRSRAAYSPQQSPAAFGASLYVITEGFLPGELAPAPTQHRRSCCRSRPKSPLPVDSSAVPGMTAVPEGLMMQVTPPPASLQQRFTFVYRVEFSSIQGFSVNAAASRRADRQCNGNEECSELHVHRAGARAPASTAEPPHARRRGGMAQH
jgi:hypothetical protein